MTRCSTNLARGAAACALVLALSACGDDGDSTGASADAGASSDQQVAESEGGCAGTDLQFENLQTGVSGTATTALAASDGGGPQHTVHVADFALTEDDLPGWRPEVPEGQNVITLQLTVFINEDSPDPPPLEVGTTIQGGTQTLDTLTFMVRHFDIDDDWSQVIEGDGVGGEMTITSVGDTFCFEVDYRDQDKVVSGTVEAPVFTDRMF